MVEADACVLSVVGTSGGRLSLLGAAGLELHWAKLYLSDYGSATHQLFSPGRLSADGDRVACEDQFPEEQFFASALYTGWMQPQEYRHVLHTAVDCGADRVMTVACFRSERRGPFGLPTRRGFRFMMPLLRQIALMSDQLRRMETECSAMMSVLDRLTLGVVLLDGHGRLTATNESAREIVREHQALSLGANGVVATNPNDNALLRRAIARAVSGEGDAQLPTEVLAVADPDSETSFTVGVSRLAASGSEDEPNGVAAALFISDPRTPPQNTEDRLRLLYGLTRLEARLAVRIAQGLELDAIAKELRISIHTARAYLKQVFAKTNVHRQAGLVRIVVGGAAQIR